MSGRSAKDNRTPKESLGRLALAALYSLSDVLHVKPVAEWFVDEIRALKKGWILLLFLALISFGVGWYLAKRSQAKALEDTLARCSATNQWFVTVLSDKDATILRLKHQSELTHDEQSLLTKAVSAYDRGKFHRDVTTNWVESAKSFEEAFMLAFSISIKHPEKCSWAGEVAGKLATPYLQLGRTNDATTAVEVKRILQSYVNSDFVLDSSSPCLSTAFQLYEGVRAHPTR